MIPKIKEKMANGFMLKYAMNSIEKLESICSVLDKIGIRNKTLTK